MKQRLYAYLSIAVLVLASLAMPAPSEARILRVVISKTLTTGATTAFTTDTSIFSRKVTFQAETANAATAYVGTTGLTATSAATLQATAEASLAAGIGYTPKMSDYYDERGELYRLSDYRCGGTTGDQVRLVYETKAN